MVSSAFTKHLPVPTLWAPHTQWTKQRSDPLGLLFPTKSQMPQALVRLSSESREPYLWPLEGVGRQLAGAPWKQASKVPAGGQGVSNLGAALNTLNRFM